MTRAASDLDTFYRTVRPYRGDPEKLFKLGNRLQKLGKHLPAIETYKDAIHMNPDHVQALNAMAISYDRISDYKQAERAYRRALEINPDLDYLYNNLGYSYLQQGRTAEAAEAFERAIALNPEKQRYRNNQAMAAARLGKLVPDRPKLAGAGKASVPVDMPPDVLPIASRQMDNYKPVPPPIRLTASHTPQKATIALKDIKFKAVVNPPGLGRIDLKPLMLNPDTDHTPGTLYAKNSLLNTDQDSQGDRKVTIRSQAAQILPKNERQFANSAAQSVRPIDHRPPLDSAVNNPRPNAAAIILDTDHQESHTSTHKPSPKLGLRITKTHSPAAMYKISLIDANVSDDPPVSISTKARKGQL